MHHFLLLLFSFLSTNIELDIELDSLSLGPCFWEVPRETQVQVPLHGVYLVLSWLLIVPPIVTVLSDPKGGGIIIRARSARQEGMCRTER